MQTRPATAPEEAPRTLGFPRAIHSAALHANSPVQAARCVDAKALTACADEPSALPALNPNQPTHNNAAPSVVYVRLCGGIGSCPTPRRLPISRAQINAEIPDVMWTTVPPAKSIAVNLPVNNQP